MTKEARLNMATIIINNFWLEHIKRAAYDSLRDGNMIIIAPPNNMDYERTAETLRVLIEMEKYENLNKDKE